MTLSASVIIRTKNSSRELVSVLKALASQSYKPKEVWGVDSGSTDKTESIIRSFGYRFYLYEEAYFPAKVLNRMIEKTSSDLIIFLNSDAILLHPNSLKELIAPFKEEKVAATFGRQVARPDAWAHVRREYERSFPKEGKAPEWIPLSLPLAAIRREVWKLHPFSHLCWGSEDCEWGLWAKAQGYEVRYVPEASVIHSHNYTFSQLYGRRFIEGEADSWMLKKSYPLSEAFLDWVKRSLREPLHFIRMGVDRYGYYQGRKLGYKRVLGAKISAEEGQRVALLRHPSSEDSNSSV